MKPLQTTVVDTLNNKTRSVSHLGRGTHNGTSNLWVTVEEVVSDIGMLKSKVDTARRSVLRSVTNQGHIATVKSRFMRAEALDDGKYLLQTKVIVRSLSFKAK